MSGVRIVLCTKRCAPVIKLGGVITSWAKPCILRQYLYTGKIPVNKDFGTCR